MNQQHEYSSQGYSVKSNGKLKIVRLLIEKGANVSARDKTHSTPLHLASSSGMPEITRLLIKHGANVKAQDRGHRTPLHLASSWVSGKNYVTSIRTGLISMNRMTASTRLIAKPT